MKIIFLADAHLKGDDDPNQVVLCSFLASLEDLDKLIILGDLFDFWTGNNKILLTKYLQVLKSLYALSETGTEIIYIEGNHDFIMGPYFTETLGAKVFTESCGLELDGKRIYMAHGDTIGMTSSYALWKGFLKSPLYLILTGIVPESLTCSIAEMLSNKSRGYNKPNPKLDRRQKLFATEKTNTGGFDGVVLGHSHTPGIDRTISSEGDTFYANPGGWANDQSYLLYEDGEFTLEFYDAPTYNPDPYGTNPVEKI